MEITAEWLKGFFDGEGCVSTYKSEWGRQYRLIITNTCKPLIDAIAAFLTVQGFGFGISIVTPKNPKWKVAYHIQLSNMEYIHKWFIEIGTNHPDKLAKWEEIKNARQYTKIRYPIYRRSKAKTRLAVEKYQLSL